MNETAIRKRFKQYVKEAGGKQVFAIKHDLSLGYVCDMYNGRRGFSENMLKIIGLRIDYVEID